MQVLDALREGGVDVRLERQVVRVSRTDVVLIELDDGTTIEADQVLAAFGRVPGTAGIGLDSIGIDAAGPLVVGDDLRVPGHDWLFAIGDVNGRALLTHMGKYQGRLAADAILGRAAPLRSDGARSPRVIFTDPRSGPSGSRWPARRRPAWPSGMSTSRRAATPVARSSAAEHPGPRGSSSTRTGASSSGRRSPARRWPRRSMPPRSRSSPRSRSTISGMRCRRSRRAASCG